MALTLQKPAASAVPQNSAKVNTCGVKRKPENGVTDLVEPAVASDGGAAVLAKLGLTQNAVPPDGNCLYHALAFHLKRLNKSPTDAGPLRRVIAESLKSSSNLEQLWDRQYSKGRPCPDCLLR